MPDTIEVDTYGTAEYEYAMIAVFHRGNKHSPPGRLLRCYRNVLSLLAILGRDITRLERHLSACVRVASWLCFGKKNYRYFK